MTIAIAWVAHQADGLRHLYFASDSRSRGGYVFDGCPKIMTLPRSDSAICFAGELDWSYPLMMQISNAIAAHGPSRHRNLDIVRLKDHLLRIASDLVNSATQSIEEFNAESAAFIFGGYSWHRADFMIWTFTYNKNKRKFTARPSSNFHHRLEQIAFIGDWASPYRRQLFHSLRNAPEESKKVEHEPLIELSTLLRTCGSNDTIGGAPQVIRIGAHMNTRTFIVPWGHPEYLTLYGRKLFEYENCDFWSINPNTGLISPPTTDWTIR
jgi:hypothetical protein